MFNWNNWSNARQSLSTWAILILVIVGLLGHAPQASAISLTTSDEYYLGNIFDGNPPGSNEDDYINTLLDQPLNSGPTQVGTEFYTRSGNLCGGLACPDAVEDGSIKDDTSPSNTIDVTGFEYLLGKYDADQAGSYVWYVGGLTGNQTIPTNLGDCGATGCGLSHWSLFNGTTTTPTTTTPTTTTPTTTTPQVPEPASLFLVGSGLIGISAFVRRRRT